MVTSGIKVTHPISGTTFEYLMGYKVLGHPLLGLMAFKVSEPGCRITYPDGTSTIVFESDYDHISPLKPSAKDIF